MPLSRSDPDGQGLFAAPAPEGQGEGARCTACEGGVLVPQNVNSAFWQHGRLLVVEDVPALVCQTCGEQYYADETAMQLDMMRGRGFRDAEAARKIEVCVFAYRAAGPGRKKE